MKSILSTSYIIILSFLGSFLYAQYPHSSLSFYMPHSFNPARSGEMGEGKIELLHRQQLVGFTDAPFSSTLAFSGKLLAKSDLGTGILIDNYQAHILGRSRLAASFSIPIIQDVRQRLGIGIALGGINYRIDYTQINEKAQGNTLLGTKAQAESLWRPEAGIGLSYSVKSNSGGFQADLAFSQLPEAFLSTPEGNESRFKPNPRMIWAARYNKAVNDQVDLELGVLGRHIVFSQTSDTITNSYSLDGGQLEIHANLWLKKQISVGAYTRINIAMPETDAPQNAIQMVGINIGINLQSKTQLSVGADYHLDINGNQLSYNFGGAHIIKPATPPIPFKIPFWDKKSEHEKRLASLEVKLSRINVDSITITSSGSRFDYISSPGNNDYRLERLPRLSSLTEYLADLITEIEDSSGHVERINIEFAFQDLREYDDLDLGTGEQYEGEGSLRVSYRLKQFENGKFLKRSNESISIPSGKYLTEKEQAVIKINNIANLLRERLGDIEIVPSLSILHNYQSDKLERNIRFRFYIGNSSAIK